MVWIKHKFSIWVFFSIASAAAATACWTPSARAQSENSAEPSESTAVTPVASEMTEGDLGSESIFSRAWRGGIVVFMVLLILVALSIATWAVAVSKLIYFQRIANDSTVFIKSFWDSRSLNDLNSKLSDFPYSPVREVFRGGYAELVRANQMRDQAGGSAMAFHAAIENLTRSLQKAKIFEKRRLEKYLPVLSISASAAPFIGLFGTVWGIMGAFEGIVKSGNASLPAVAPGIAEALIATAFGLAAAIPAAVAYNIAQSRIRGHMTNIDGFSADFLNIVQRYLVADKPKSGAGNNHIPAN